MSDSALLKRLAAQTGAAVAKKAAAALFSGIAPALGVPVTVVALCALLGVTGFLAVFGALPEQARDTPEWPGYVAAAQQYRLPVQSDDGAEEGFQVTPGLIMALDVLTGKEHGEAFADVADILLPHFSYTMKTLSHTDPKTGQVFTRKVTLLRRASTFEGTTWLEYTCEFDGQEVVLKLESERFEADLGRVQAALEKLLGQVEPEMAEALVKLAKSIDQGRAPEDLFSLGGK